MVAQMKRAEWVQSTRQLPLLAEIAPTERVEGHATVWNALAVLHDELGTKVQISADALQVVADQDA